MAAATDNPKVAVVVQFCVRGADLVRAMRARQGCERDLTAGAVGHGRSRRGCESGFEQHASVLAVEGRRLRKTMTGNIFRIVDSLTGNAPWPRRPADVAAGFSQ
jgi:hypothetical protein